MSVKRRYVVEASGGVRLSVNDSGPSSPVATIVLLHSWALNSNTWTDVTDHLEFMSPRLRVLTYDCRGHGESDSVPGDLRNLGDDLAAVIDRLVPAGPLVVVGHAMGGSSLLALGQWHQKLLDDRVDGAVFVSTSAGPLVPDDRKVRGFGAITRFNTEFLRRGGIPAKPMPVVRQAVRAVYGSGVDRSTVDATIAQAANTHPQAASALLEAMLTTDLTPAIVRFAHTQVGVVAGGADRVVAPAQSRAVVEALSGARHVVLPGAGHILPLQRPTELATVIGGIALQALGTCPASAGTRSGLL